MYCSRPAASTPVAWMWAEGAEAIQTWVHAGGMASALMRSSRRAEWILRPLAET